MGSSRRAVEYRICNALQDHEATFADQQGQRIPHPTTRWVFHYFVGIPVLHLPGPPYIVLNLTEEPCTCFSSWDSACVVLPIKNAPQSGPLYGMSARTIPLCPMAPA